MSSNVLVRYKFCAGQEAEIETAIHSMNMKYEDENTDVILLVDATKTFNSLNRQSFLHKIISYLCYLSISYLHPFRAIFVKNYYSISPRLFIVRGTEITSKEGITQGDTV